MMNLQKIKTQRIFQKVLFKVINVLEDIFNSYKDTWKKEDMPLFKVRPGYGYDKFYLNWVDGSYDMSLQSLVNFILYEKRLYKKFLSKEAYQIVEKVVKNYPESIPGIYDDFPDEQEKIDYIIWVSCYFMGCCFKKNGFDYYCFEEAGYIDDECNENFLNSCYIYENTIISNRFELDLKEYLISNSLTHKQLKDIVAWSKSLFDVYYLLIIAEIIYSIDTTSSKEIVKISTARVTKKSECTQIALFIKKYFNDKKWADKVLKVKEIL